MEHLLLILIIVLLLPVIMVLFLIGLDALKVIVREDIIPTMKYLKDLLTKKTV